VADYRKIEFSGELPEPKLVVSGTKDGKVVLTIGDSRAELSPKEAEDVIASLQKALEWARKLRPEA